MMVMIGTLEPGHVVRVVRTSVCSVNKVRLHKGTDNSSYKFCLILIQCIQFQFTTKHMLKMVIIESKQNFLNLHNNLGLGYIQITKMRKMKTFIFTASTSLKFSLELIQVISHILWRKDANSIGL